MQTAQHTDGNVPPRVAPLVRVAAPVLLLSFLLSPLQADSATRKPQTGAPTYAQTASAVPRRINAPRQTNGRIAPSTLLRIVRAEDERRWETADLGALLSDKNASVRARAALAAGRIGDEGAVAPLSAMLRKDADESVRAVAAFALGEIEAASGADALLEVLRLSRSVEVRARALEALGKIAAALPATQEERRTNIGASILAALEAEHRAHARPSRAVILEGLTAALRSRHTNAPRTLALFLSSTDARLRADAANALARLRAKESLERLRTLVASDTDPIVRANAARALAAAEDAAAYDVLLARATTDADLRVRVSAVRALAALKDARAVEALLKRAEELANGYKTAKASGTANPSEANELLEIATTLGRLAANTNDTRATTLFRSLREAGLGASEVETAFARVAPTQYMREPPFLALNNRLARGGAYPTAWQSVAALAQGLGELAQVTSAMGGNSAVSLKADAQILLRSMLEDQTTPPLALPAVLQAIAAFKPIDLGDVMRARLTADDVIVRATAADLLSTLDPDPKNARALIDALPRALEEEMNDAALSILAALAKQKTPEALEAVRSALGVPDYVVRRRAVALLRGDAPDTETGRVETVATRNRASDYQRALGRVGRKVSATVITDKGNFQIELLPSEAPLTVDNFVELARRGFFNNVAFHRVVPNFVIQGGDPRGDGNGGPGYQIRCEINAVPYVRGAVGMALSGKDTGGSQWFVTHSPQPHLDGGYTVFGRVADGMEVVDRIAVGDRIHTVTVFEGGAVGGSQRARRRLRARP